MFMFHPKLLPLMACFLIGFVILAPARLVVGTPPSNIDCSYVFETETLNVEIQHATDDVDTHYIARIEISVNSVLNQTRDYTSQPNMIGLSDSFIVPAVVGDVINVTAICSVSGQLTKLLTLTAPETSTTTTTTTSTTTETTTTTTTSTNTSNGLNPMLLIGVGGAIVIVLVLVLIVMRRK